MMSNELKHKLCKAWAIYIAAMVIETDEEFKVGDMKIKSVQSSLKRSIVSYCTKHADDEHELSIINSDMSVDDIANKLIELKAYRRIGLVPVRVPAYMFPGMNMSAIMSLFGVDVTCQTGDITSSPTVCGRPGQVFDSFILGITNMIETRNKDAAKSLRSDLLKDDFMFF